MDKPQGLKTLGDYRRTAHDPRCYLSLYPESKNDSPYEALKIALRCVRHLISISCADLPEKNWWFATWLPGTEYEMSNPELFQCVELMEFANTYKGFQSFERLFPGWRKRPDANARFFTSAGLSYLEAAFGFVRKVGGDIIFGLQEAYKKYRKEGHIKYVDPSKFLSKTPTVDDLEIRPVPDIIIRTWFGDILKWTQKWIQENNISRFYVEAEFNSIKKQLEYERNNWTTKNLTTSKEDTAGRRQRREPLTKNAKAVLEILKALPEQQGLKGREILEQLEHREKPIIIDQSTLTKNIIPALRPYGVKNKSGAGYYISEEPTANIP